MEGILGSGGVEVEFDTGRPRVDIVKKEASKAKERLNDALLETWALKSELHENSHILKDWLELYRDRLLQLAQNDTECQTLEKMIRKLRQNLEFKVVLAEKVAKRVLGPEMLKIVDV